MTRTYNPIEQRIIRTLYKVMIPLTIYEVAKETDHSYPTVKKYIAILTREKVLVKFKAIKGSKAYKGATEYAFNNDILDAADKEEIKAAIKAKEGKKSKMFSKLTYVF